MTSPISVFFSKEITCLPSLLDKYVGKYYNNAFGNTITWGFFIWLILHFAFDRFVKAILKQMKYPEYLRSRIAATLWNFGFCAGSFLYCYATLSRNKIGILNFNSKFLIRDIDVIPGHYIFGFVILSTFYAQNFFWEGTQNGSVFTTLESMSLTVLASLAYLNSCVELLFIVIYVNSLVQCALELSRTFSFQMHNKTVMNLISAVYFTLHVALSLSMYLVAIPLYIFVPVAKRIKIKTTPEFVLLNISLWIWLMLNIYNSAISKIVRHYIWHLENDIAICGKTYLDCSLFPPRTDTAFTITQLRKEIEEEKDIFNSQIKRPKAALYQTLKCVVAVRQKLKLRRASQPNNTVSTSSQVNSNSCYSESLVKNLVNEIVDNAITQAELKANVIVKDISEDDLQQSMDK